MVERDRLMPRADKGLPFAEALNETAREHHGALAALDDDPNFHRQMAAAKCVMQKRSTIVAALAESELRDREADVAAVEVSRSKLAAGEEELAPAAVMDRILAGESRVGAWRDHRGLSVTVLAGWAGLETDHLYEVEAGTHNATVDELRRIATVLSVTLDDLSG